MLRLRRAPSRVGEIFLEIIEPAEQRMSCRERASAENTYSEGEVTSRVIRNSTGTLSVLAGTWLQFAFWVPARAPSARRTGRRASGDPQAAAVSRR